MFLTVHPKEGEKKADQALMFICGRGWHNHHSVNQFGFAVFGRAAEKFFGRHALGHFDTAQGS
jgi:hypothetical protein